MRILAVDMGNSKLAAALVQDGRARQRWQRTHGGAASSRDSVDAVFEESVGAVLFPDSTAPNDAAKHFDGTVIASVVPSHTRRWEERWAAELRTRGRPCLRIDHRVPFPFAVEIESPETVGADRYCNVAGAVARGAREALIVDLGTANTYDVLSESRFVGGLIAPGLVIAHEALLARGAQLPELAFKDPGTLIGRNTNEAIQGGSFHQGVGGVRALIEELLTESPRRELFLTGGLAALVAPRLGRSCRLAPDLTLEGAAHLFEVAAEKLL